MSTLVSCEKVSLCPRTALCPSASRRSSPAESVCGFSRRSLRSGTCHSASAGEPRYCSNVASSIDWISGAMNELASPMRVIRFSNCPSRPRFSASELSSEDFSEA